MGQVGCRPCREASGTAQRHPGTHPCAAGAAVLSPEAGGGGDAARMGSEGGRRGALRGSERRIPGRPHRGRSRVEGHGRHVMAAADCPSAGEPACQRARRRRGAPAVDARACAEGTRNPEDRNEWQRGAPPARSHSRPDLAGGCRSLELPAADARRGSRRSRVCCWRLDEKARSSRRSRRRGPLPR